MGLTPRVIHGPFSSRDYVLWDMTIAVNGKKSRIRKEVGIREVQMVKMSSSPTEIQNRDFSDTDKKWR
jgi:hypothetical protein